MESQHEPRRAGAAGARPDGSGPGSRTAVPAAIAPFVTKLDRFVPLTDGDVAALADLVESEAQVGAQTEIAHEGEGPTILLVTEGLVCQQRIVPDGRRQILDLLVPGDICDQHLALATSADYALSTLTPARVTFVSKLRLIPLLFDSPRLAVALRWCALQEEALLRERIVALGRRNAPARIAYLLCELYWRLDDLGLVEDGVVAETLTQTALADAVGLTPVHVSRVLKRFREQGIVDLTRTRLHVVDLERLRAIAWLDPSYLHFEGPSRVAMRFLKGGPSGADA